MAMNVGFLLFPRFTQLDLTGPYEVLSRLPSVSMHLVSETLDGARSDTGLTLAPTHTFESAPQLDLLCVPGGAGVNAVIESDAALTFLEEQGARARYVTSVCTGALALGAAGLLRGYRATTHWRYLELLSRFGAEPVKQRVVIDRNRVTGAGVTAGIDFALTLAAELYGEKLACEIQLYIEYDPAPPFASGSPQIAAEQLVYSVRDKTRDAYAERVAVLDRWEARRRG
ncbi:MAG TPA: DJ-1/PfpI family protein [Polyangiaceae bacterium]|nr:DJ-1/PfpI family protein [Polyangiaceae bacterium]